MKWLLCFFLAACHAAPPVATVSAPQPIAVYRFVDQAASATVTGDLAHGLATLTHPLISPSPLPDAPDGAFPRAMQVAFAEPDLTRLLSGDNDAKSSRKPAPKIDFTWNRTSGVYEAREALFLPDDVAMRFSIPAMGAAQFSAQIAGLADAELVVTWGDDQKRMAAPAQVWQPISFELPAHTKPLQITLHHAGNGPLFVGQPIVRAHDLAKRPNIIFVLVDTLRIDALVAMPRLQAYAAQSAQFTTAITTATWTRPSLIGMFGGDIPSRLGHSAEDMIPSDRERRRFRALRPPLLPRRLAELGYETRAIGNNFFLLGFPRIGLDVGLDSVTDVRHLVLDTPAIAAEAIRALEAPHDAPQFLYLHFDTPHWPYTPPPAALAKVRALTLTGIDAARDGDVRRYLGEAAYADVALGDLFDALERTGHDKDTIVMIVGDHGEVFDPAHSYDVDALGQPTLHHHGWSAYDEILRVPLVIGWKGHIVPRTVDVQTSFVDLAPTLAELAGAAPLTSSSPTAGRSLAAALTSPQPWSLPARPAFAEGQDVRALRDNGWLYLARTDARLHRGSAHFSLREELYDVTADPLQHRDRLDDIAHLTAMRARFAALSPTLPDFAEPVLHLAVAESPQPHRVSVKLTSTGQLWVRGVERGRAHEDDGELNVELDSGGRLELVLEPADATLELSVHKDGAPTKLLVGAQALPLIEEANDLVTIDAAHLSWLDTARPPYLGEDAEVVLWRDPIATPSNTRITKAADSEVATMMQRWGYAQPSNKK